MTHSSFNFRIGSFNVRGINNHTKRIAIFNWIIDKSFDIMLLQETFSSDESVNTWQSEWEGASYFAHGSKHSRGVAILIRKGFDFQPIEVMSDCNGRYIIVKASIQGDTIYIANIYAPNTDTDKASFFKLFHSKLNEFQINVDDILCIGGDWNTILEPALDKKGGRQIGSDTVTAEMKSILFSFDLIDIWRIRNPTTKRFTYRQRHPLIQSRLDYFMVSKFASDMVNKASILSSFCSDHSCISLDLSHLATDNKGNGFWKFNNSLIEDSDYVNSMKRLIGRWDVTYNYILDKRVKWDIIKYEIRKYTCSYSSSKKKELNREEIDLQRRLNELEILLSNTESEHLYNEYDTCKTRLNRIYENKAKGVIVRSRARWLEQGEKSTKYFFNLEKSNFTRKHIRKLRLENNDLITESNEILSEASKFYEQLYKTSNVEEDNDGIFLNDNIPKLTQENMISCEKEITENECYKALQTFTNNKSPGNDGLSKEFYLKFWRELSQPLMECYVHSQREGMLSVSQRQAIIVLIDKKDKDRQYLTNWRPISLLNLDYKLLTKILANRIKPVLSSIISPNQTGYVQDRSILDSIRLIQDLIYHQDITQRPGILLMIDFQKAFDSLEWKFLLKALKQFNFGPNFIKWVEILYNDIRSCILNNGKPSNYFKLHRGVRQGDPLSPYLFIIALETLACAIRINNNIKGITVNFHEFKLTQYADDLTLTLNDASSARESLNLIKQFGKYSGLKINIDKTEAMLIGSLRTLDFKINIGLNVKITNEPIRLLGVYISKNPREIIMKNFETKIEALLRQLHWWKARDLSLTGKILIVKSLALSKFHFISSVVRIPSEIINRVNSIMYEFIWGGRTDRVRRAIFEQDFEKGGYKMINFKDVIVSESVMWMKKYLDNVDRDWKFTFERLCNISNINICLRSNYDVSELQNSIPEYYLDSLFNWFELKEQSIEVSDTNIIFRNYIWYNKNIKVGSKCIYNKRLFSIGMWVTGDLFNNGAIIPFNTWLSRGAREIDRMVWLGIIEIVRPMNERYRIDRNIPCCGVMLDDKMIEIENLLQKHIKQILAKIKYSKLNNSDFKFKVKYTDSIGELPCQEWEIIFLSIRALPISNKLKDLQYKIVMRFVATNYLLYKMNKTNSQNCCFCHILPETIEHLFFNCMYTKDLWLYIFAHWNNTTGTRLLPSLKLCILGIHDDINTSNPSNYLAINTIIVLTKSYIMSCKYEGLSLSVPSMLHYLKNKCSLFASLNISVYEIVEQFVTD